MNEPLMFNQSVSIQQMQDAFRQAGKNNAAKPAPGGVSFEEMLSIQRNKLGELKFSKHAGERLADREIDISREQMDRLKNGVKEAGSKGINETLVMVDNLAFIVNVKNNTVVTAVKGDETRVFSNIDGAVIA
ncbi:MAG: flagellar protein [Lachnospiraceae bacterium]|nr:flagellar protein [Lachnospiraceae bacterium]